MITKKKMTEEKATKKGEKVEDLKFRMEKIEEMIFKTEDDVRTANLSVERKTKYRNQYIKDDIFQFKEGIWHSCFEVKCAQIQNFRSD